MNVQDSSIASQASKEQTQEKTETRNVKEYFERNGLFIFGAVVTLAGIIGSMCNSSVLIGAVMCGPVIMVHSFFNT